jgi:uncharacterized membrane protein
VGAKLVVVVFVVVVVIVCLVGTVQSRRGRSRSSTKKNPSTTNDWREGGRDVAYVERSDPFRSVPFLSYRRKETGAR